MSPDAINAAAESLYGSTATPAQSAPAVPTTSVSLYADTPKPAETAPIQTEQQVKDQALADALYDKPEAKAEITLPPEIATLRASEDNGPYSRIGGYDSVPFEAVLKTAELAPETLKAVATEYRHMAADVGANADQAGQILASVQTLTLNPPTPEQAAQMQGEAAELVVAQYGEDAGKMLDLAKRMVARDPRLQGILDRSGAGNHPRTVMTLIELAVQQRSRGRLK
jgi:hypothetical protein